METQLNHGEDSSRIVPPTDPEQRKLYDAIAKREADLFAALASGPSKRASKNSKDYRHLLGYSMDATDEFLRETSRDPFYNRPDHRTNYEPGGWI